MRFEDLLNHLESQTNKTAFIYDSKAYSYKWLKEEVKKYLELFSNLVSAGEVVQLCADYCPTSIAIFLALMYKRAILAPLTNVNEIKLNEYTNTVQPQMRINITKNADVTWEKFDFINKNDLINELRESSQPGLIIMSSGTTGNSKAILHNLANIISKHKPTKKYKRILTFLLFDHIGGINSLLNSIVSGNTLVLPTSKDINSIANLIHSFSVKVLITSPSFLNLMTINDIWAKYDLSNLEHINYGSEVMPQHLLTVLSNMLPNTRLIQSYGTSETGVLKTSSEKNKSLLIKINDINIKYRVVDGKLEVKSENTMLGYLNAPSPFTVDGWFKTGDMVEIVDGEWLRILGRESDIINIGGNKVYPAEIENIISQIPQVHDVTVYAEPNIILGNIVKADVYMDNKLNYQLTNIEKIKLIRKWCSKHLENYKVPQKFEFINQLNYSRRLKKIRLPNPHTNLIKY